MYEQAYGLTAPPFQINPDPSFYFESKGHGHAHQYLRFGAFQGEGFIVVTGEIGAGKTTLLRALLAELDPSKVVAAQIVSTQLAADELLSAVALAFGISAEGMNKARLLATLEAYLASLATSNRRALLIIDEAQNLGPAAIEELRMLSNFQFGNRALLQSFLVGQPELRDILRLPQMEQLRQRVIASCHLGPMSAEETRGYIEHRLHHVGWQNRPAFDPQAFSAIFEWTGGVPRRINLLCSRLLLSAFLDEADSIDAERVNRVGAEIRAEISGEPAALDDAPAAKAAGKTRPAPTAVPAEPARGFDAPPLVDPALCDLAGQSPVLCVGASYRAQIALGPVARALAQREDVAPVRIFQFTGAGAIDDADWAQRNLRRLGCADLLIERALQSRTLAGARAEAEAAFSNLLAQLQPGAVVLCGDDHFSAQCALAARQAGVPIVRIDAGQRHGQPQSFDESNRLLIDRSSSLLFAPEPAALQALAAEGLRGSRVQLSGSPLVDVVLARRAALPAAGELLRTAGIDLPAPGHYALVWLDPTAPVRADTETPPRTPQMLFDDLRVLSRSLPVVWPVFAAQRTAIESARSSVREHVHLLPLPEDFVALLGLMQGSRCVLTDSSWLSLQSAALGRPCVLLAEHTEHVAARECGRIVTTRPGARSLFRALSEVLDGPEPSAPLPAPFDGRAAHRIALHLADWLLAQRDPAFLSYLEGR